MLVTLVLYFAANCFIVTDANLSGIVVKPIVGVVSKPCDPAPPSCQPNCTLKCGKNEKLDKCPSYCISDFCPTGDGQNDKCPSPHPCPSPACKCEHNYRRAQNGTCIPAKDCPEFKCKDPNEEHDACPLCSTDDCSDATPTGECPLSGKIGNNHECNPACRCKEGFWRNDGKCVPYNECPGKLCCGKDEVVVNCPNNCTTDYCPNSPSDLIETCTNPCPSLPPACKCKANYKRDKNGDCIPKEHCPSVCTLDNEEYTDCKKKCPSDLCKSALSKCIPDTTPCEPGCVCKPNFLRKKEGEPCIPECECRELKNTDKCKKPCR